MVDDKFEIKLIKKTNQFFCLFTIRSYIKMEMGNMVKITGK